MTPPQILERDANRERLLEKNARDARVRARREGLGRSAQAGKEAAREPDPQEARGRGVKRAVFEQERCQKFHCLFEYPRRWKRSFSE